MLYLDWQRADKPILKEVNMRGAKKVEKNTFNSIVDLAEVISKKLKQDGNPHQSIVITQNKVTLVSEDKGQPLNIPTGPIKR